MKPDLCTILVPVLMPERGYRCVRALLPEARESTVVVYNAGEGQVDASTWLDFLGDPYPQLLSRPVRRNVGVAASWNHGRAYCLGGSDLGPATEWLVVLSEAVEMADGGEALLGALTDDAPDIVCGIGLGWKCAAVRRRVLEGVGEFDENFWPGYYEDTDYLYRMGLAGFDSPRENGRAHRQVEVPLRAPVEDAHAIREASIPVDFGWLRAYYVRKWGGDQGHETFAHPHGDASRAVDYWALQDDRPEARA